MPCTALLLCSCQQSSQDSVALSAGEEIRADPIFSGLGEEEPIGLGLGQPPFIMRFLKSGGLTLLRGVMLVSFLAAIVLCITAGATVVGQQANAFIWSVWEPVVFLLFLVAGALWCTVCPLSTAGRMAKRAVDLERPPPSWLNSKFAASLPVVGFFAILWAEWVFHMTEVPLRLRFPSPPTARSAPRPAPPTTAIGARTRSWAARSSVTL